MQFSDVIGQNEIKRRLLQQVDSGRIPHAQLFCGSEGAGILPLAVAFAQYVSCEHKHDGVACGSCPSCVQFAKLAHPDLHLVFPMVQEAKKVTICDDVVNEFREAFVENPYLTLDDWMARIAKDKQGTIYAKEGDEIIRKLNLKTYQSPYKIMLIWHPEKMQEACANQLLKILEEPPSNTLFLLVTDVPERLLGTILSRVQRISVPPLTDAELLAQAQKTFSSVGVDLNLLTRMAQGSWSRLCSLVEQNDEQQQQAELFTSMMRLAWSLNIKEILQWDKQFAALGREAAKRYFQYAQRMIRENFVLHLQQPTLNYLNASEQAFASKFSRFINERNVYDMMQELQLAEAHIEQNVNIQYVMLDLYVKLYRLLRK